MKISVHQTEVCLEETEASQDRLCLPIGNKFGSLNIVCRRYRSSYLQGECKSFFSTLKTIRLLWFLSIVFMVVSANKIDHE